MTPQASTPRAGLPVAAPSPIRCLIADTSELARQLLDVLRRESALLSTQRLEGCTALVEAKSRLIAAYASKLEEFREVSVAPGCEVELEALRALSDEVQAAARHNAAALEGAMDASRRLLEIVVNAVNRERSPAAVGYGRVGNRASAPRATSRSASMMVTKSL